MNLSGIIGESHVMKNVFRVLAKVKSTDTTVLMTGEPGTGKELLARALHKNSPRASHPFVSIKCGAISSELLEWELFGHVGRGSAMESRSLPGRLEQANGGTVFLDEIDTIDLSLQVKILRLIQEKYFEKVGGFTSQQINVRIIAATQSDLEKEVEKGSFREDLYYRLNVVPVELPPLRARREDIMLLAECFLEKFCEKSGRSPLKISKRATALLTHYYWPGNVRELENFMERLAVHCEGLQVLPEDLPDKILAENVTEPMNRQVIPREFEWPSLQDMNNMQMNLKDFLEEIERNLLMEAFNTAEGVKNQAAEILGIKRTTLIEKLKKKSF